MRRLVAVIAVVFAFGVMGSMFVPQHSEAHDGIPPRSVEYDDHQQRYPRGMEPPIEAEGDIADASPIDPLDAHLIGSFEGREYQIDVYATDDGPRYTVYAVGASQPLVLLASSESISETLPDLTLPEIAEAPERKQIMLFAPGEIISYD